MLALVLAVLPFGVAMASDDHGSTKTEPTKTEPVKTDDSAGPTSGSDDSGAVPTSTSTTSTTDDGPDPAGDATDDNGSGDSADDHPKPELGHSVVVDPGQGTVKVHLPGSSSWHSADAGGSLPVGSVVDVTHGHVTLLTAVDAQGNSQSATFWGGRFEVRQAPHGVTELVLSGPRPQCAAGGTAVMSANHSSGLWGHDNHGRFRTRGRNAVATVRGTTWFVGERCGGTFTKVTKGAVRVYDTHTHRTVLLHAGESHLSRG
jgi:hypothetical protein